MSDIQTVNSRIREFVLATFPLARKRGVKDNDHLLDNGIVDSMGVLELVEFLQQEFGLQVSDEELLPENFQNIQQVANFVSAKLGTNGMKLSGPEKLMDPSSVSGLGE
jgi:acyl carrier protein